MTDAHLSHWTRDGKDIWQVIRKGMPVSAELDNAQDALAVYEQLRVTYPGLMPRPFVWTDGERWENFGA